jgi:hypothetical protein
MRTNEPHENRRTKIMSKIICQACGAEAIPQSEEMMNGSPDMYRCPNHCGDDKWEPVGTLFQEED